jgi:hypothetical protein
MLTQHGVAAGIPKGELAGASANWQAVIKTIYPQLYRLVAERAHRVGGNRGAPYFVAAGSCAVAQLLLLSVRKPAASTADAKSGEAEKPS